MASGKQPKPPVSCALVVFSKTILRVTPVILGVLVIVTLFLSSFAEARYRKPGVTCIKDHLGYDNCTCPEEPITAKYVDKKSETCEYYYLCHLGVAMKLRCHPHYAFHPTLLECIARNRVPKNLCRPFAECPVFPNKYVEDPKDCSMFYLCLFGRPIHWKCPEKTYYDPDEMVCKADEKRATACESLGKANYRKAIGAGDKEIPTRSIALTAALELMAKQVKAEKGKIAKKTNLGHKHSPGKKV